MEGLSSGYVNIREVPLTPLIEIYPHGCCVRFAGVEQGNVMMVRNHSLVITNATTANTGHYLCSGVNTAGAAIERSQVTRIFAIVRIFLQVSKHFLTAAGVQLC